MNSKGFSPAVAVIDIGSNTIKLLVAAINPAKGLEILKGQTEETRISAGISKSVPMLSETGIQTGIQAIQNLLDTAKPFSPVVTILVATSAVRDAGNGDHFRTLVKASCGHEIRILTGEEEAHFIGRGLTADPALSDLKNFYVFDLGGGSMECLSFRNRTVEQAVSLQLGCVRLTERYVPESASPLSFSQVEQIANVTRRGMRQGSFRFGLPVGSVAIATGGTATTMRIIRAVNQNVSLNETAPVVPVVELRALLTRLAPLTLLERKQIPGVPGSRADVLPVALVTLITLAEMGGFPEFRHSLFNLRYGVAAEALERATAE